MLCMASCDTPKPFQKPWRDGVFHQIHSHLFTRLWRFTAPWVSSRCRGNLSRLQVCGKLFHRCWFAMSKAFQPSCLIKPKIWATLVQLKQRSFTGVFGKNFRVGGKATPLKFQVYYIGAHAYLHVWVFAKEIFLGGLFLNVRGLGERRLWYGAPK